MSTFSASVVAAAALLLPLAAVAQAVAVVVTVPKPWYAPKALVVSKMRDTVPQYAAIPGLAHKTFTLERDSGAFGGLYHWRDAATAQAHFSPAWHARVERERGTRATVRLFDVPFVVDNRPGWATTEGAGVVTLVTLSLPAALPREPLLRAMQATLERHRQAAGLLRKLYLVGDGVAGGAYLWQDAASAERWFNAAWREAVVSAYGVEPRIECFDAPIVLPSTLAP
jgi:hypothetical protein